MESKTKDFTYATDQDCSLLHKYKIDAGGYGDVHEMYNLRTGKCFARKLLHLPNPRNKLSYIENEVRAVKKLCDGRDPNVIHVFTMGEFTYSPYYFIDMELCDLSLRGYLYGIADEYAGLGLPPLLKTLPSTCISVHIWNIMRQIASGLKFIHDHGEAHRDLKPSNVLYSRKDSIWKLTDFGLASEATASHLTETTSARGSEGYRSPELASSNQFSNKVDIWSMGCLLHELVAGRRAFYNDYAVLQYCSKSEIFQVHLDDFTDVSAKPVISETIRRMLQKDPGARPSAEILYEEFCSHCQTQIYGDVPQSEDMRIESAKNTHPPNEINSSSGPPSQGNDIQGTEVREEEVRVSEVPATPSIPGNVTSNDSGLLIDLNDPVTQITVYGDHHTSAPTSPFSDLGLSLSTVSLNSPLTPLTPLTPLDQPNVFASSPLDPLHSVSHLSGDEPPGYSHTPLSKEAASENSPFSFPPSLANQNSDTGRSRPLRLVIPTTNQGLHETETVLEPEDRVFQPILPPESIDSSFPFTPTEASLTICEDEPPPSPLKRFTRLFTRNHSITRSPTSHSTNAIARSPEVERLGSPAPSDPPETVLGGRTQY